MLGLGRHCDRKEKVGAWGWSRQWGMGRATSPQESGPLCGALSGAGHILGSVWGDGSGHHGCRTIHGWTLALSQSCMSRDQQPC